MISICGHCISVVVISLPSLDSESREEKSSTSPESSQKAKSSGDSELDFDQVYSQYFDFIWRSARGLGFSETAADDVAQDVFIIVHRKLSDFDGTGSLRSWLFGITRRVCKDHRRANVRRGVQLELDNERDRDDADSPQEHAASRQALKAVEAFANTLDLERRELLALALIEGLPVSEVAQTLGLNHNTTYSRVRVLRRDLASHLGIRMQQSGATDG